MIVEDFDKRLFHKVPKKDKTILQSIPTGLAEINTVYGQPYVAGDIAKYDTGFSENLQLFTLPYPMRLSWPPHQEVRRIYAHKRVGAVMIEALHEVMLKVGYPYLRSQNWDMLGGVFNFRTVRGNENKLSTHSWGIAIDLNPAIGYMGADPELFPHYFVTAFKSRGFVWGGDWPHTDPMHFQACRGY